MKIKKLLATLLAVSMMLSLTAFTGSANTQQEETPAATEESEPQTDYTQIPEGASFCLMTKEETAVTDSAFTPEEDYTFYLYSPSDPHDFDLMSGQLNAVIFVYPDQPYATEEEAYAALVEMGLIEIAESTPAYIIIPNPLKGESYTEADLNLYYESQIYLAGGKIISYTPPTGEYTRCTYNNLQYIIAEGEGATFVNNVLSQNAGRIAAILTFGGEMDESLTSGLALPAYLVNATDTAVEYYKTVNEVDSEPSTGYFVNSSYTEKQVYVTEGSSSFDADTIATAWGCLLSRLTRAPLETNVVIDTADMSEWVLMSWPNYAELGLDLVEHTYTYEGTDYVAYDYVPESYTGEEAVPLVVLLHGYSEDPLCPAATCGWAEKAAEEGFILIAPDYINDLTASGIVIDCIMEAVNQALETYNIDTTRIYLTGFSMGGMSTMLTGFANADVFAAVAPMAGMADIRSFQADASTYDMPTFVLCGTIDSNNNSTDEDGNITATAMNGNIYPYLAAFNEIILGDPDYSINMWGYAGDLTTSLVMQGYTYVIDDFYAEGYTNPMLELVTVENVAHACSNVYADLAWAYMSNFARGEDGSVIELNVEDDSSTFRFTDDSSSNSWSWASDYIYACYENGIIAGYEAADGTYYFAAEDNLTRAEAVRMIVDAFALTAEESTCTLSDISGHWAEAYIQIAASAGVVHGYEDGTFRPDATITRAEFVKLVVVAAQMTAVEGTVTFQDISGHWAASYILNAATNGVVHGMTETTFAPDSNITRAQAAKIIAISAGIV